MGCKERAFPITHDLLPITRPLSIPILYAEVAFGVGPLDCAFDAGYHTGATFEAAGIFDDYLLFFFIECVKVPWTDSQALSCRAFRPADIMVYDDVAFLVCFEGIDGKFLVYLHGL